MLSRAELKRQYKATPPPMGAYQIRNTVNGKILVQCRSNLTGAKNRTWLQLRSKMHPNRQLQQEWNEYGEQSFVFEVLEELEPMSDPLYDYRGDLAVLEELWIEKLQPYDGQGYNIRKP